MKTLAELRSSEMAGQAQMTYPLCVVGKMAARAQILAAERDDLSNDLDGLLEQLDDIPAPDPDKPGRPGTIYDSGDEHAEQRAALQQQVAAKREEITAKAAEIDAHSQAMNDNLSPVVLESKPYTAWSEWVEANPPREGKKDDDIADCNFDALVNSLQDFIISVSNTPLQAGDWDWVREVAQSEDLKEMAWLVIRMQNSRVAVPKWQTALSGEPTSDTD